MSWQGASQNGPNGLTWHILLRKYRAPQSGRPRIILLTQGPSLKFGAWAKSYRLPPTWAEQRVGGCLSYI